MALSDDLRDKAADLLREAAKLEREERDAKIAAIEAAKPKSPDLMGGPVIITFTRYLSGRLYSYAAVGWRLDRRQNRWAVTASVKPVKTGYASRVHVDDHGRYTWSGLLEFIGEANWPSIARVTSVQYLLKNDTEPAVKETMGTYGTVKATEVVEPWHGKAGPFTGPGLYSDGANPYGPGQV